MKTAASNIALAPLAAPAELASLQGIIDGFKNFQVLQTGFASGLFDWLQAHGPAEKSAIASALDLRGAHLGALLQALEDLGLLSRHNTAYVLAPGMARVLCADSPWGQAAPLQCLTSAATGWSDLSRFMATDWVQTAQPINRLAHHPLLQEARRLATHLLNRPAVTRARKLLCIDGADGLLAAALCQQLPDLYAVIVTPAEKIESTGTWLAECGVTNRCRLMAGSPLELPTHEDFDLAILFHSLYPVRKSTVDALTATAQRLSVGGELISAHWFCLEACETAPGGLRDLDKAVLTDSHPLCHVEQFGERLTDAGLTDAGREDLAGDYGNTKLHFGRRPAAF
jgi:hypothetical protein